MASKKISFSIPDWMFDNLQKLPIINGSDIQVNDLFKACAINRMIERGYLDEFGCPIEVPHSDFNVTPIDFSEVTGEVKRC